MPPGSQRAALPKAAAGFRSPRPAAGNTRPSVLLTDKGLCDASFMMKAAIPLLFCMALASCEKPDQAPAFEGKTISKLSFRHTTPKYVQDTRLRNLMSSKVGDPYRAEKIDDNIRILWESGLVDDVRFLAEPDGEKVHLIAEVSTSSPMGSGIHIYGNRLFSGKVIIEQISESYLSRLTKASFTEYDKATDEVVIYEDSTFESEVLPGVCRELETFYASQGHPGTKVAARAWKGGDASIDDFIFVITEPAEGE